MAAPVTAIIIKVIIIIVGVGSVWAIFCFHDLQGCGHVITMRLPANGDERAGFSFHV